MITLMLIYVIVMIVVNAKVRKEQNEIQEARKKKTSVKQSFLTKHYVALLIIISIVFASIFMAPILMFNIKLDKVATINDDVAIYVDRETNEYFTVNPNMFNPITVSVRHLNKDSTEEFLKHHYEYEGYLKKFMERKGG